MPNPPRRRGRPPKDAPLRDNLYRPAIGAEYKTLVERMAESCGLTIQETVELALREMATLEELDDWNP